MPSTRYRIRVGVASLKQAADVADALAVPVAAGTEPPEELGVDLAGLGSAGFTGQRGQTLVQPRSDGPVRVAVGIGGRDEIDTTLVRDLAAEFARAVPWLKNLAVEVPSEASSGIAVADFAQAATEGVLLARWRYFVGRDADQPTLESLQIVAADEDAAAAETGVERGRIVAAACSLGRDLANCPATTLSAVRMAEVAVEVGTAAGLEVEVFDKDQLIELGCGGLLGVNRGSVEPPRMIRLRYQPAEPTGRIALVGKGIMYDSGGISLKPSDESHAQMKNDMTGAAAVLAGMTALRDLGCTSAVTGYLMCTDNMPSGSAMKLGDVLTMRNGTTVEVLNTDAEGRLVMADALALATEEPVDAIVDIATLTGACLRTFGVEVAGVMGNDPAVVEQLRRAGDVVDEPVWELPLHKSYRSQLDSTIADLTNMGGINAGSITAGLFLQEFVDGKPWGHVDIAGTAQLPAPRTWRNKGATGFGTKLLIEFALRFVPPGS
ncbi:leucyl aminopeptidase family protein [Kribbella sindirgiensis]|uniref:Probable cytosol aminopeptidase n=1 Tax=Kribbella sindirgiensis TaxID=1124744 RepID=A0A4R0IUM7_9ACTN|nr:leucyl aminopeptidase family protein [Kribbella sindirgiensis]